MIDALLAFALFVASVAGFAAAKSARVRALLLLAQPVLFILLVRAAASVFELPHAAPALAALAATAAAVYATEIAPLLVELQRARCAKPLQPA